MANCLFYCFKLLLLKYFSAANFQPEANVHIQVTNKNEEYAWVLSPTLLFSSSIQTFLNVKTVLLLLFKDTEIEVFLSNNYIWKEFDTASTSMDSSESQREK